jgi:hypothetical protein
MLNLDTVTLVIVDCLYYEQALKAIKESTKDISYAKIKIFTNNDSWTKDLNAETIIIPKIEDKQAYCKFLMKSLNSYIDTSHILLIQWDGYVKNPNAWTNEFLEYDYIGAPWWYPTHNVGNGGFSLRSKKLLETLQKDSNISLLYPEDHHICRTYGNYLTSLGIKFAPEPLAARFAIEGLKNSKYGENYTNQFGFHSLAFTRFPEEYRHRVWMTNEEINTIRKYLKPTDIMLEWGSGGSTLYFSHFVDYYYSIEHDTEYYNSIEDEIFNRNNIVLKLVPNNSPRSLPTKKEEFIDYIRAVNTFNKKFDKVLIDGRARQWCGIEVLPYIDNNSIIFVHDWVRDRYHTLLEYYYIVEEIPSNQLDANGLVVLRKK